MDVILTILQKFLVVNRPHVTKLGLLSEPLNTSRVNSWTAGSYREFPAANWLHCKIMLVRITFLNFLDKNVPIVFVQL